MGPITPRWEWRTFGSDFGEVEARLRASSSGRRHSAETYVVSGDLGINAKIRDGALDIKVLQEVDRHGLELWLPVVKAPFPLTAVAVTKTRYGSAIDGCTVEIADLTFNGAPIRTVAVETADPGSVWRTVQSLGLSAYDNVNYVKALERFLTGHTR
jgi:exopolyphosphatase/guanosine-5'-triphosphate,3'-diphosphate pyrophosphatase